MSSISNSVEHITDLIARTPLDQDPFCHVYMDKVFPSEIYQGIMENLPDPGLYHPLNLRLYSRDDGISTRDLFHLTPDALLKLPERQRVFWTMVVKLVGHPAIKSTIFAKLAPDIAERFGVNEDDVPQIRCEYEIMLMRDTQDYRIKPHPDGLNKIVTMQFYLPPDDSQLSLGTSLYKRNKKLFRSSFEEVKRFEFRPNSGYAFAVSDRGEKKSWHGREQLTGFTGVRNTLMVLFQEKSPRSYAI